MPERIWLDVPFGAKDDAKAAGARWDPAAKRWYAPRSGMSALAPWAALSELPELLPGEDRAFGSGLFCDLVPSSCWFSNLRTAISPRDWDRVRRMIYRRAGYRCEACGAGRDPDARRWLEAHERWTYLRLQPGARLVQRLVRLVCLCTSCHRATHFGHAQVTGQEHEALAHLCHVNGWTERQAWEHVDAAAAKWRARSAHVWELDLSMLTDAGITLAPPPGAQDRVAAAAAGVRAAQTSHDDPARRA